MPLEMLLDVFLVSCRATNLSPRTISWYREKVQRFIGALEGTGQETTLGALTARTVERFIQELLSQRKWSGHRFTPPSAAAVSASNVQGFVRATSSYDSNHQLVLLPEKETGDLPVALESAALF